MSLDLQLCGACGAVQYPSREVCRNCLSDALEWQAMTISGTIVSEAIIHRSLDPQMLVDGPIRIGAISTSLGVRFIALLAPDVSSGMAVTLQRHASRTGATVAIAATASPDAPSPNGGEGAASPDYI